MRGFLVSTAAIVLLSGCGDPSQPSGEGNDASADSAPASGDAHAAADPFPQAGEYDIVRDRSGQQEVSRMWMDASNRQAFEKLVAGDQGSNCRDRQVTVDGGSFSVRMTCDAPDGDIRNIAIQSQGSYSKDSIDIATDTKVFGMGIRETASYKLHRG